MRPSSKEGLKSGGGRSFEAHGYKKISDNQRGGNRMREFEEILGGLAFLRGEMDLLSKREIEDKI